LPADSHTGLLESASTRPSAHAVEAYRGAPERAAVTGHELIADAFAARGVTHCYGVPALPVYGVFGACAKQGIRPVGARHQQGATLMAAAHNYIAGCQKGVVVVSPGPALTNAITGVLVARDNCWPLVLVGGAAPNDALGKGYFQEFDGVPLLRPVTKWAGRVDSVREIPEAIGNAFEIARSGRPGPVYVEVPEDVLAARAEMGMPSSRVEARIETPSPDASAVARSADLLREAKRPLLIIGKGARWAEPWDDLPALVHLLVAPFVTSPIGRGSVSDDHPLCMNAVPWLAQSQADVVLLLGGRLDWTFRYGAALGPDTRVIQVDIDAQELRRNERVDLGVAADAGAFLRSLLAEVRARPQAALARQRDDAWIDRLRRARVQREADVAALASSSSMPISPYRLAAAVRECLPGDAICILDGNVIMAAGELLIPSVRPVSRLTAGSNGCMGVGIPFAIGAKLQCPDSPVLALCGDFAVGLNAMEMETAVRYKAPIVVVVSNNDGNAGALRQKATFGDGYADRVTMFQPGVRYDEMMKAVGGYGAQVVEPGELEPTLRWAMSLDRPCCVSVRVDPDTPYPPR
jgi:2-hydroxyacyl-CoA lyase 1